MKKSYMIGKMENRNPNVSDHPSASLPPKKRRDISVSPSVDGPAAVEPTPSSHLPKLPEGVRGLPRPKILNLEAEPTSLPETCRDALTSIYKPGVYVQ